jgi:hypothetical protein
VVVGLTLWWFFSLDSTLGLYKWRPDYRVYFIAVGCLGVVTPLLALAAAGLRRFSARIGNALTILTLCVSIIGLAVPLVLVGYFLSYSLQMSPSTPPVLLGMDGSGANGVPDLALTFRTEQPSKNILRYGVDQLDQQVAEEQPVREHVLVIKDLRPATRYQWQLNDGEVYRVVTPRSTAASPGSNDVLYHFAASGDSHVGRAIGSNPSGDPRVTRSILNVIATSENPFHTFFIVGDHVHMGMYNDYWVEWLNMVAHPSASVPLRPIMGNHDGLINGAVHYLAYLYPNGMEPRTGTRRYYRVDAGSVHFIMLNILWSTTESFTPPQKEWFVEQLASISPQDWTIVLMHSMVYASGDEEVGMDWYDPPEMIRDVAPLLEQYRVDLVISGHDHHMEFLQHHGVSYCIIGTFGGVLDPSLAHVSPASVWRNNTTYGFLDATVRSEAIELVFRDATGNTLQTFTVSQNR